MPKISEMRESKFLKKEDVGRGALATITSCQQHNVALEGAPPEHKWTLSFQEFDKPLVLNATNIQVCAQICESDDTDDWGGHQIVLYTDPNVMYAGQVVGGIRIRPKKAVTVKAPVKAPVKAKPAPADPQPDEFADEDEPPL